MSRENSRIYRCKKPQAYAFKPLRNAQLFKNLRKHKETNHKGGEDYWIKNRRKVTAKIAKRRNAFSGLLCHSEHKSL